MKCITLTQPWATLIAIGAKRIETRSWATSYRGPLAIHAAKTPDKTGTVVQVPFFSTLKAVGLDPLDLPSGAIVAVCELVDCVPTGVFSSVQHGEDIWQIPPGNMSREYRFGDYSPGRFAWLLADVRALPEPIPARGALNLWEYKGDIKL